METLKLATFLEHVAKERNWDNATKMAFEGYLINNGFEMENGSISINDPEDFPTVIDAFEAQR